MTGTTTITNMFHCITVQQLIQLFQCWTKSLAFFKQIVNPTDNDVDHKRFNWQEEILEWCHKKMYSKIILFLSGGWGGISIRLGGAMLQGQEGEYGGS